MLMNAFGFGVGLDLHARTTYTEERKLGYSFISGVALKIGDDVLEVDADGSSFLNGEIVTDKMDEMVAPTKLISLYPFTKTFTGTKHKIVVYNVFLGKDKSIKIRANSKTGMMFVDVSGSFNAVGLLGTSAKPGLIARDGRSDLTGEWNRYGENWQVNGTDPKLFRTIRAPQYPEGCRYSVSGDKGRRNKLRGLGVDEAQDLMDMQKLATEACAGLQDGPKKMFCLEDVILTGDGELAMDPFYH